MKNKTLSTVLALFALTLTGTASADNTVLAKILDQEVRGGAVASVLLAMASINWESQRAELAKSVNNEGFSTFRARHPQRCEGLGKAMRYDFSNSTEKSDAVLMTEATRQFSLAGERGLRIDPSLIPVYAGMMSWSFAWNQPPLCACNFVSEAGSAIGAYCGQLKLSPDGAWPLQH